MIWVLEVRGIILKGKDTLTVSTSDKSSPSVPPMNINTIKGYGLYATYIKDPNNLFDDL